MKRFSPRSSEGVMLTVMVEDASGSWIAHSDHEAALAEVVKERDALRALLLDCEMIETSDGVVHLRSNIKDALEAIRAKSDKQ